MLKTLTLKRLLALSFFCFVHHLTASEQNWVEATGQALIQNNDLAAAREQAINDAKQQAALQSAAFISSTQQIDNGILEIDNVRISTLGSVRNIDILDEQLVGRTLHIRIKAQVDTQTACPNGYSGYHLKKSIAISAFPLQHPSQANLGNFRNLPTGLATALTRQLNQNNKVQAYNAGNISLYSNLQTANTRQLPQGALSNSAQNPQTFDTQYILAGVVRDISMLDPSVINEENWLIDFYNRQDFKSNKHLRNFALDLYLYDGMSGRLISQNSYQIQGRWNFDKTKRTGFGTPAFYQTDYGQKIQKLIEDIEYDLGKELRCLPFTARITQATGNQVWINAGINSGIQQGDQVKVLRKNTLYNPDGTQSTELIATNLEMRIQDIQVNSAKGQLNGQAAEHNIQSGDLVQF